MIEKKHGLKRVQSYGQGIIKIIITFLSDQNIRISMLFNIRPEFWPGKLRQALKNAINACLNFPGQNSGLILDSIENFWSEIHSIGLLIYSLISENQGLEKLRSVSNLRKISDPAHLDFFSVCHLDFFSDLWYKSSFFF